MKYLALTLIFCFYSLSILGAEKTQEVTDKITSKNQKKQPKVIQETVLGMNVSGNKELPNVLYIVPWKASASFSKPPIATRLVDEIYAPVDPHAFSKKVMFYHQLTRSQTKQKQD